jgi:hypothetical protein
MSERHRMLYGREASFMNAGSRSRFHPLAIASAVLVLCLLWAEDSLAKSYPIIAYGTRTYVAETTETGGSVLVRVYRRMGAATWERYGGFTIPADEFATRRAQVRRDPSAGNAVERVYFTGQIIGWTPFQPSSPLYRPPRFRRK